MDFKSTIKGLLRFSFQDRIGLLIIAAIVICLLIIPYVKNLGKPKVSEDLKTIIKPAVAALDEEKKERDERINRNKDARYHDYTHFQNRGETRRDERKNQRYDLFYFDPNTVSADGWRQLGIREKTIHTIQNYLSKGGKFRRPEDVQKIYGLFPDEYERIAAYIRIESAPSTGEVPTADAPKTFDKTQYPKYKKSIVDVNAADTTALKLLPGIGSKLAAKIVNFRNLLGGFYSIDQLGETYGVQDSVFQKIKPQLILSSAEVKKININTATVEELKAHPYIKWQNAKIIVAYREQHGSYQSVNDLKKVMGLQPAIIDKAMPYLSVE